MNLFWNHKKVLMTGGTSGLGRALAIQLTALGAQVVVVARGLNRLENLSHEFTIHPLQADMGRKEDILQIAGEALGILGDIDVLINNASTLGSTPLQLLLDSSCEDLEHVLQTNLMGPFRLTKAILPHMLLKDSGLIVNISSDAAVSAYPTWGGYSVSKAALDHLSRIWAEELKETGIRILSIDPGDMHTPMHLAAIPDADVASLYQPDEVATDLLRFLSLPLGTDVRYHADSWRKDIN